MKNTGLEIKHTYLELDKRMFSKIEKKNVKNPEFLLLNKELGKQIEVNETFLESKEGLAYLSGNTSDYGELYAQAYAGHQFGQFTILGDGRAMIIGEQQLRDGSSVDLQLKGSGRTPYSRRGDGKATLSSVLREYLISEAMHALGVPTTRSLAVIKTNEIIQRQLPEKGGILCRVAKSHIRVGTFEYASSTGGKTLVKELADYAINRHYPYLKESKEKYKDFLTAVIKKQATLIAKWQSIGFIHGVMNTDNVTISGETIDYGPCAFLNEYDPNTVFSSIDHNGRYAYTKQPFIGSWNVSRFAQSMLELFSSEINEAVEIANTELRKFEHFYIDEYYKLFGKKIGILEPTKEEKVLIDDLLILMEKHQADFTNTFRLLTLDLYDDLPFSQTIEWQKWFQKWTRFLGTRQMDIKERVLLMQRANPAIIPRNLLVEEALQKAVEDDNMTLFNTLLKKLQQPHNYHIIHDMKFIEPAQSSTPFVTYCGT